VELAGLILRQSHELYNCKQDGFQVEFSLLIILFISINLCSTFAISYKDGSEELHCM